MDVGEGQKINIIIFCVLKMDVDESWKINMQAVKMDVGESQKINITTSRQS